MCEYYSCQMVNQFWLNFDGRVDGEHFINYCSEPLKSKPAFSIAENKNVATILMELIDARLAFINEGYGNTEQSNTDRIYTSGCVNCVHYQKMQANIVHDGRIHYINLSMYPSPCQSKCIYCNVHQENQTINTSEEKESYEKIFGLIDYAMRCGAIAPDVAWQVSCGEISIHPYKNRILQLVKNSPVMICTNCFKFDSQIAAILKSNPHASINLSIDAGTPKTWEKIKGVNNFEQVAMNLTQYSLCCSNPNQITLKYIVLPGINDTEEDYLSLIEIMKILRVTRLTLSRDTNCKYDLSRNDREKLIRAAANLVLLCYANKITPGMFTYTQEEQNEIMSVVKDLMK